MYRCTITRDWYRAINKVEDFQVVLERIIGVKPTPSLTFQKQRHAKLSLLKPIFNWTNGIKQRKDEAMLRRKLREEVAQLERQIENVASIRIFLKTKTVNANVTSEKELAGSRLGEYLKHNKTMYDS